MFDPSRHLRPLAGNTAASTIDFNLGDISTRMRNESLNLFGQESIHTQKRARHGSLKDLLGRLKGTIRI